MPPASQPPLVVHVIYALDTGGLENGLVNIINRCPPQRYRHTIVCLTHSGPFAKRIQVPGVDIIELHKKPGHDLGMYWRLWRTLRRLRPAVVHTRNMAALETHAVGVLALPRCRRVHGEHGRDVNDLDGSNPRYLALRRFLNPFIHRFMAVSQDLAGWLCTTVGIAPDKVVQVYNGVDCQRFGRGQGEALEGVTLPKDALVVGTVGRLAAVKDQAFLLRAMARLLQQRPELAPRLCCLLVGDGPERARIEDDITRLGLSGNVYLLGDRSDVPALLGHMDLFVLPSLSEGISNTILEAMASGLPVIATAVGGNPELVSEAVTGALVASGDEDALAAAMYDLLSDSDKRLRMGRAARERIENEFNWDQTVQRYLAVYDALLTPSAVQSSMGH